ncbi:hypothetical protein BT93_L1782 [Corymbia citriodora subsp. variegata]|uniref:Uncharacterized protein n=1 Tax=Corymbia citriodora subsp. variegata TaxID=360336 RepID=A0A8T0CRU6_CORYI|nr:hypothetical protein BT93_L1782 [Corymbia citriodora subsp. variegata]
MVRVYNILSSIPRRVKRSVKSLRKKPTSNASPEVKNQHHRQQQPQDDQVPELLQEPSEALQTGVENNGGQVGSEDESRTPESEWVVSIKENLERARQDNETCSWAKLSIYKIPHQMNIHKWRCLQCMLARNKHDIGPYLDSLKKIEETARACYEGPIGMTSEKFVELMVIDGCFVIELFLGFTEGFTELGYPHNDPVFSMRESLHTIQRDMIMLENQIPLFILERLLQLSKPDMKGRVANLALEFFSPLKPTGDPRTKLVFRLSLLGSGPKPEPREQNWRSKTPQQLIPSVTELREAGIRFTKSETDGLWNIKFQGGTLWIPQLLIHDGTRSFFLNLMAFEQSHKDCSNDITSYVIFMYNLINSAEDVGCLHKCEIIQHWLGSNAEVVDLFKGLCQEVVFDINNSHLSKLGERVNVYCGHSKGARLKHRCIDWASILKQNYFSNPWSFISLVAACLLLVLTFVQTFYTVYGFYRPRL